MTCLLILQTSISAPKLTREYKERSRVSQQTLDHYLPGCSTPPTFGGGGFWLNLPKEIDASELQKLCKAQNFCLEPGAPTFADSENHLLLGSLIEKGVSILAKKVATLLESTDA
jgi:DNA-binding transcriptional MocR family regulator